MLEAPYDEFIDGWDVAEMIRVFPDYIQYDTWCGPCWIDYAKYHYKVAWNELIVKAFEYAYVDFGGNYEETKPFYFFRDWKFDEKVAEEYKKWKIEDWIRIHEKLKKEHEGDLRFHWEYNGEDKDYSIKLAEEKIEYVQSLAQWHEFEFDGDSRYSLKAKNYILAKIAKKDFDQNVVWSERY